jgi:plasmid maintenance system antidote protein VapI
MFGLHPLKGNRAGQYSMTLTGNYRLIVEKERLKKGLARRMGRPVNAINETINGKKAITAETALQLEEVMPEIPARFWLNLETYYELTKALINKYARGA